MVYKYKGINKEGKKVQDRIVAPTLEDAKRRLQAMGILYERVTLSGETPLSKLSSLWIKQMPTKVLSNFSRNMAIYLRAGIPLIQAIRLQKNDAEHPLLRDFLVAIETMIDEGKSFHQAMESQKVVTLPSFYRQSVKVAEENGLLDTVLVELAAFLKQQERMGKQVKKALTYPMFILIVALVMVGVMLTVVVPQITQMFDQMDKALPTLTTVVIAAGDFVSAHWKLLVIAMILLFALFTLLMQRSYRFKFAVDSFMLRVPLFGRLIKTSELARFCYTASMLLRSGVPFVHTAKLGANIIDNAPIRAKIEAAAKLVVEGKKFSQALSRSGFTYDKSFLQAVALGEETSELPQMLENLAELYNEEKQDRTDVFLGLLEPVLMIFVGGIMAVIVIAMMLPIFSMNLQS